MEFTEAMSRAHRAFCDDDAAGLRDLLQRHPELRAVVSDPNAGAFNSPPIVNVKSRAMLDVLLDYGADINAKSRWWAGGFGLLHMAPLELAGYAIEQGAKVDIHAAARLGMIDQVREWVKKDPESVHARGGDGQTPLHFAATEEIAEFLLDHGADINARDIDHESTAAQWMLGDRLEIARFLVSRGCWTDLLMAAALGDIALAKQHLERDPKCIRVQVSEEHFPMIGGKSGGTIYQWVLGWHVSPHQVAKAREHTELFSFLMERSPVEVRFLNAAWLHDEQEVDRLLAEHPNLPGSLTPADVRQVAHAARNNDTKALELLLKGGLPVSARGQHNGTPLHWAAWHGNVLAMRLLFARHPKLEDTENDFKATPLGWAIHGSENGWHRASGDYVGTVELLLENGVKVPDKVGGTAEVKAVLKKFSIT